MKKNLVFTACIAALSSAALTAGVFAFTGPGEESERKVKESEVPAAALAALKAVAKDAKLMGFEEEKANGITYYEAEWKDGAGKKEAKVTADGELMEIEESVSLSAVPKAVVDAAKKIAGADAAIHVEKMTAFYYEVEYRKGMKQHEIIIMPDGRTHEGGGDDDDGDDDDDDDDADDDHDHDSHDHD